ncbi:hypothetical protein C8Q80DRAFT_1221623 [Daedaleopsis nitida]|nr:hypothetical protein C8Q80DRAFT_1221623 [Daedaleopsis nitida]
MTKLWATIYTAALACTVAVRGMALVERTDPPCTSPDTRAPVCETTLGSPKVDDCVRAMNYLTGQCRQRDIGGSQCTTLLTVGTCKIDVCGPPGWQLRDGVWCPGYFQSIINNCSWNGLVGGYLEPERCNLIEPDGYDNPHFRLQFSHS